MHDVHSHYPENGLNKQYEQRTDCACVWVVLLSVLLLLKWLLQIWVLCALHIPALLEIWCENHTINWCEAAATPMLKCEHHTMLLGVIVTVFAPYGTYSSEIG